MNLPFYWMMQAAAEPRVLIATLLLKAPEVWTLRTKLAPVG
jgi:hypothetical protein